MDNWQINCWVEVTIASAEFVLFYERQCDIDTFTSVKDPSTSSTIIQTLTVSFFFCVCSFFLLQMWHLLPKATLMLWSEWVNWPARVKDPKIWVSVSHTPDDSVCLPISRSLRLSLSLFSSLGFGLGHTDLQRAASSVRGHLSSNISFLCRGSVGWEILGLIQGVFFCFQLEFEVIHFSPGDVFC